MCGIKVVFFNWKKIYNEYLIYNSILNVFLLFCFIFKINLKKLYLKKFNC